jgi:hypothetical protein
MSYCEKKSFITTGSKGKAKINRIFCTARNNLFKHMMKWYISLLLPICLYPKPFYTHTFCFSVQNSPSSQRNVTGTNKAWSHTSLVPLVFIVEKFYCLNVYLWTIEINQKWTQAKFALVKILLLICILMVM